MLLTITYTTPPATDFGYLLHKHPGKTQTFTESFGKVHVFYPEVTHERATVAMLLELDPIGLADQSRSVAPSSESLLAQYVNDRPYVASSFMSVAISQVFGSALNGNSKERPELTELLHDLEAKIAVLPCRGGEKFLRRLFEPLGYTIDAIRHPFDTQFPEWGDSPYFTVKLKGRTRLQDLLSHLYVLIPVLDADKHYWVDDQEINKLMRHGEGWLNSHPDKEEIVKRYLRRQGSLVKEALGRLNEDTDTPEPDENEPKSVETIVEQQKKETLHELRLRVILEELLQTKAKRVLDLGCGEGKMLRLLVNEIRLTEIVGIDVSTRQLEIAEHKLTRTAAFDIPGRVKLLQGSLTYQDDRLRGYDAALVVEVIEHLELDRLDAFEKSLFGWSRPQRILLSTPNAEYNVLFAGMQPGKLRHGDHRFEWTRQEFREWAQGISQKYGYTVTIKGIGEEHPDHGPPSQLAHFEKAG